MKHPLYRGKVFMYPCAGSDIPDILEAFGHRFDTFVFVDIRYKFHRDAMPPVPGWKVVPGTRRLIGKPVDRMRSVQSGKTRYREIEPAWLKFDMQHLTTGRVVTVCLRRGFGQYALQELEDESLAMFLHRGDSCGEGGSAVCYLANRRVSHPPLSMLFDVIKRKLASDAWIGSDGSNTKIRELYKAACEGDEVSHFTSHGLLWEREMTLHRARDCRRTVVWRVLPTAVQCESTAPR